MEKTEGYKNQGNFDGIGLRNQFHFKKKYTCRFDKSVAQKLSIAMDTL